MKKNLLLSILLIILSFKSFGQIEEIEFTKITLSNLKKVREIDMVDVWSSNTMTFRATYIFNDKYIYQTQKALNIIDEEGGINVTGYIPEKLNKIKVIIYAFAQGTIAGRQTSYTNEDSIQIDKDKDKFNLNTVTFRDDLDRFHIYEAEISVNYEVFKIYAREQDNQLCDNSEIKFQLTDDRNPLKISYNLYYNNKLIKTLNSKDNKITVSDFTTTKDPFSLVLKANFENRNDFVEGMYIPSQMINEQAEAYLAEHSEFIMSFIYYYGEKGYYYALYYAMKTIVDEQIKRNNELFNKAYSQVLIERTIPTEISQTFTFKGIQSPVPYEKPYIKDNQFIIPNPEGVNKYCDFTFVGETFIQNYSAINNSVIPTGQYQLQISDKRTYINKYDKLCQVNLDAYVPDFTYNYINTTNEYTHWHSEDTINAINLKMYNVGENSTESIVTLKPTYKNSEHKTFELKIGEVKQEEVTKYDENIPIGKATLFATPYNITCYPDLESITIVSNDKANSIETIVTTDKLKAYPNIDVNYTQLDQKCFYDTLKVKVNEITGGLSNGYTYKIDNDEEKVFPSDSIIPIPHEGDKYFDYKITFFDKNIPQEDSAHNGKISRSYETTNSAIVPDTLGVNEYDITHVACFGDSTGRIQINSLKIADPNRPISYLWNTGSKQNYIEKLPIGKYSLTLTDGTCTVESDYKIEQPDKLIFKDFKIKNAACFGYNDGAISINVDGGVEDYKYLWNNTFTTKDLEKLYAGNYHITVTDAHNCILEKDTVVTEPTKVVNNYIVHNYNICKDSELEIDAGDFSDYVWKDPSNKKLKAKNILNLDNDSPEGKYYLKTIRYDNCFAEDIINISQNDQSLKMNFLLPSEIYNDDYAKIVETSSHELDSLNWVFSENLIAELSEDSTTLTINANQLDELSTYKIKLIGYYKGCVATVSKDLKISNLTRPEEEYLPDYYDSDEILDCRIGPNPNDGNFTLFLDLTDTKDVVLTVYSINNLKFVMREKLSGLQNYEYPVNQNLPQGKYILEVKTSKSIRRINFIVTK